MIKASYVPYLTLFLTVVSIIIFSEGINPQLGYILAENMTGAAAENMTGAAAENMTGAAAENMTGAENGTIVFLPETLQDRRHAPS